jgi:hypothetical protein
MKYCSKRKLQALHVSYPNINLSCLPLKKRIHDVSHGIHPNTVANLPNRSTDVLRLWEHNFAFPHIYVTSEVNYAKVKKFSSFLPETT